jgi:hypothetical protein
MTAPDRCFRCNTPVRRDEGGTLVCANGHTQPDPGSTRREYIRMVDNLRDLRALIEENVIPELRSLREEVEALRDGAAPETGAADALVELPVMAGRLTVSPDWLRRHARELGGRQSRKGAPWKFSPAHTLALFGSSGGDKGQLPTPAPPPRPLPSRVPLLPVKDRAA